MNSKITRRGFLQGGGAAAIAISGVVGSPGRNAEGAAGVRYQAEMPDTLDLAESARYSVNALTGAAEPDFGYETPEAAHLDQRPPYMSWRNGGSVLQRPIETLPRVRAMSGSTYNQELDMKIVGAVTRDIEADGLWWMKLAGHPGREGIFDGDQVWPCEQGELMSALLTWYRYDGNSDWLKLVERMVGGLSKIALRNEDRAWYYTTYTRQGWHEQSGAFNQARIIKNPLEEPTTRYGFDIGRPLQAFSRWYAVSGDKQALDLARRLANFYLKPSMWGRGYMKTPDGPTMAVAAERAFWVGQFHEHTMGIIGLMDYALATNDNSLKEFVANFYTNSKNFGIARIGFFPNMRGSLEDMRTWAARYTGDREAGVCDEGCAIADMTWLAATLSDAGVGDYWDDVDQYVRNQLIEHQVLRRDTLEEIIAASPEHQLNPGYETDKNVLDRNIGCFLGTADPTMAYSWWVMCCNANCPRALHKAWKSIVRCSDGVANVNLLLNRVSPWLDVHSYLPYEGKVVLKNKTAREVCLRIPKWTDKSAVRCRVNQNEIARHWAGSYLLIPSLAPKDVVTLEFPVVETVEKYTDLTYQQQYTCRFRGNTLMDISPRAERPRYRELALGEDGSRFQVNKGYPLYQRDFLKHDRAPMKWGERYVAPTLI
jgi:DUF1680 family protein